MTEVKRFLSLSLCLTVMFLSSCARHTEQGTPIVTSALPIGAPMRPQVQIPSVGNISPSMRHDVIHIVGPLETVWRISKMYNVNANDIIRANHLNRNAELAKGQKLVIPKAAPIVPIIPLYPSNKWHYIIIHHSATDYGNALDFDRAHRNKGWEGIGYDFVVDNGTEGREDGQIEVSPRWVRQQDGAHCKASDMNIKGIGICVVGNFNDGRLSSRQMESLMMLVNKLKAYYRIPTCNVMGHGKVPGAATDCPGKSFPWGEFYSKIEN